MIIKKCKTWRKQKREVREKGMTRGKRKKEVCVVNGTEMN